MKKITTIIALILAGFFGLQITHASANEMLTQQLEPEVVELGTFYNGTTVTVKGQVPADADVVVRLSGEGEELHLKRKGKVGGLLWMNTADLTFHDVPRVFKLLTPKGMEDLSGTPIASYGFEALKERIEIEPKSSDEDFLLKEFVRLKEHEGMYAITPGSIQYTSQVNGMKTYSGQLNIPPGMKQGHYNVEVIAFRGDSVIGRVAEELSLKQVGLPEQLSKMAFGHEIVYGVMSVVIALMAGLFMGIAFKDKGGAH